MVATASSGKKNACNPRMVERQNHTLVSGTWLLSPESVHHLCPKSLCDAPVVADGRIGSLCNHPREHDDAAAQHPMWVLGEPRPQTEHHILGRGRLLGLLQGA